MRFGVGLGADTTPEDLPGIVDYLESSGADSVWFSELVYSPAVDPFIGMAYTLSRTTRLKAGTSVAILPGRHPVWRRWPPSRPGGCCRRSSHLMRSSHA